MFTSALFFYQIYLIGKGLTTYETICNSFEKYGNPFNLGFCKNLGLIFCEVPKCEFLETSKNQDPSNYKTNDQDKEIELSVKSESNRDDSKLIKD